MPMLARTDAAALVIRIEGPFKWKIILFGERARSYACSLQKGLCLAEEDDRLLPDVEDRLCAEEERTVYKECRIHSLC